MAPPEPERLAVNSARCTVERESRPFCKPPPCANRTEFASLPVHWQSWKSLNVISAETPPPCAATVAARALFESNRHRSARTPPIRLLTPPPNAPSPAETELPAITQSVMRMKPRS